jgi:hypothetical protein
MPPLSEYRLIIRSGKRGRPTDNTLNWEMIRSETIRKDKKLTYWQRTKFYAYDLR